MEKAGPPSPVPGLVVKMYRPVYIAQTPIPKCWRERSGLWDLKVTQQPSKTRMRSRQRIALELALEPELGVSKEVRFLPM